VRAIRRDTVSVVYEVPGAHSVAVEAIARRARRSPADDAVKHFEVISISRS
jgi:hypothetical protein